MFRLPLCAELLRLQRWDFWHVRSILPLWYFFAGRQPDLLDHLSGLQVRKLHIERRTLSVCGPVPQRYLPQQHKLLRQRHCLPRKFLRRPFHWQLRQQLSRFSWSTVRRYQPQRQIMRVHLSGRVLQAKYNQ